MTENNSPVSNFYRDRSILITGGTGFMGKVLVEKLLRSCSEIKTIYLLLRPKKGKEGRQRLEDLLKAKLFERVKNERPDAISKLVAIQGDLTSAGLGIASDDVNLLVENVSVVFHSAATVNFDEPLKKSVEINVLGTRRLLELCQKMTKLEAFIHVSTAYCNCDRKEIDEVVYPSTDPPQKIIDTIEWMNEDLAGIMTPHLIGDKPNTYTYTKALAETLLVEEGCGLPVAIIRPTIVSATWKEPFPGWVDNYNSATGGIAYMFKGIIRSVHTKTTGTADFIPVDVIINLMITVAWYTACHRPQNILVYNSSSGSINKVTWTDFFGHVASSIHRYPILEMLAYPDVSTPNSEAWGYLSDMLYHRIPAYFIDFVCVLTGRKPKLIPLFKKLHQRMDYFLIREWTFSTENVLMLQETLSLADKKDFNFNVETLHWPSYLEDYVLGVRKYLFKEEASLLPSARQKLKRYYLYAKLSQLAIVLILWKLISVIITLFHRFVFL